MGRYGLVLATVCTLLTTGGVLQWAGWLGPRAAYARPAHVGGREAAANPMPDYYRHTGPRHWRDCLSQH